MVAVDGSSSIHRNSGRGGIVIINSSAIADGAAVQARRGGIIIINSSNSGRWRWAAATASTGVAVEPAARC